MTHLVVKYSTKKSSTQDEEYFEDPLEAQRSIEEWYDECPSSNRAHLIELNSTCVKKIKYEDRVPISQVPRDIQNLLIQFTRDSQYVYLLETKFFIETKLKMWTEKFLIFSTPGQAYETIGDILEYFKKSEILHVPLYKSSGPRIGAMRFLRKKGYVITSLNDEKRENIVMMTVWFRVRVLSIEELEHTRQFEDLDFLNRSFIDKFNWKHAMGFYFNPISGKSPDSGEMMDFPFSKYRKEVTDFTGIGTPFLNKFL